MRVRERFEQLLRRWARWRALGARGERAAWRYLRRRGYVLLGRNMRRARVEADLVLLTPDGRTVVVAEVKTLASDAIDPRERVDVAKRRRLERFALSLLRQPRHRHRGVRFDVLAVRPRWYGLEVTHVVHAWTEGE